MDSKGICARMYGQISRLSQGNAEEIADNWHYEGEYAFYDMANDREDYEEIISLELRAGNYFEVSQAGDLLAFFCVNPVGNCKAEIGLGLRPDLTGQGLGRSLMTMIEQFLADNYSYQRLSLSVAAFNHRALKVYRAAGYKEVRREFLDSNGSKYEFIILEKEVLNTERRLCHGR